MSQNLVSAVLSPADATAIQQNLTDAASKLQFLLALSGQDIKELIKVGNVYIPFIESAYQTAKSHPEILSGVFDKEEFFKDCELISTLRPILNQLQGLTESLQNTFLAVNSDAMTGALEVYASVKQNRDKVPGLGVVADDMAVFFKRSSKKTTDQKV